MPNKMLIDASHREETRVVVTRGNRIEEFDFESQDKKQLKGNIYLARVTRVEPSLQAAFVEYGGNRHGFLAFSEIHPDYYQIPVADRQALLRAEAEAAEADEEEDEAEERGRNRRRGRSGRNRRRGGDERNREAQQDAETSEAAGDNPSSEAAFGASDDADENGGPAMAASVEGDVVSERLPRDDESAGANGDDGNGGGSGDDEVESVGAEDALEEVPSRRRAAARRQYKIQEVIKRRQILLVQVVKEERGNKGAALTTYLSLAGRYSVLMPNTARGGGISRKITSAQDRKRLKDVVSDLEVPQGMGVILRTAGANRTKAEIKRDYEYLMRLWETVRNLTLQSTAPALVYEEGSLIKRSVRDLYNKDIDEILVAGEEGYREAKDFMRMLMPSHAKMVQPYRDNVPIFARNGIEAQLDRMLQPQVTLKSGGYIIINQTEALVSIDVNSGRSTKEHSIEDTALQTNLEAAEEVARQLRLRDLAGLIVIDFIDMEENRNNRAVEKRLKDHLKHDRARIQVGRISHFGLLEMSRQRIRASVLESTMKPCPHCGGTGHVRSDSSVALHVVRGIEEFLMKDARHHICVRTPVATALYVLNHKRQNLAELEARFGLTIEIQADDTVGSQHFIIARGQPVERPVTQPALSPMEEMPPEIEDEVEPDVEPADDVEEFAGRGPETGDGEGEQGRKKRRRRRRRGGRDREGAEGERVHTAVSTGGDEDSVSSGDGQDSEPVAGSADSGVRAEDPGEADRKKRRRGKRGGKRNRRDEEAEGAEPNAAAEIQADDAGAMGAIEPDQPESPAEAASVSEAVAEEPAPAEKPKRARRTSKRAAAAEEAAASTSGEIEASAQPAEAAQAAEPAPEPEPNQTPIAEQEPTPKPRASRRRKAPAETVSAPEPAVVSSNPEGAETETETETKPRKAGWWQRKGFF